MKSSHTKISILLLAIIGGVFLHYYPQSSTLSFVAGVFLSALLTVIKLNRRRRNDEGQNKSLSSSKETFSELVTLYVGNLSYNAKEIDIKNLFSRCGNIHSVKLLKDKKTGKRRGFCFVVMPSEHAADAVETLNNIDFMGRSLKVRFAKNK